MLTASKSPDTDYSTWYSDESIKSLIYSKPREIPLLRYVFSYSGDDNPLKQFIRQFKYLKTLGNIFKVPVCFISVRPGIIMSSHFIFGIIIKNHLIIINPLGDELKEDFYKTMFKLKASDFKKSKLIETITISSTVLQRDKDGIISCGPICVELFNHFSRLSEERLLEMTKPTKLIKKQLTYSERELEEYVLTVAQETLPYNLIDISKFFADSESLTTLSTCTTEDGSYEAQLQKIRKRHATSAPEKAELLNYEQSLVFNMDINSNLKIEEDEYFLKLKKELEFVATRALKVAEGDVKSLGESRYSAESEGEEYEGTFYASASSSSSSSASSSSSSSSSASSSASSSDIRGSTTALGEAKGARDIDIDRYHKKLDALAQLFAGYSECTAVTTMNGAMYVAANEVSDKGSKYKNQKLIIGSVQALQTFLLTSTIREPEVRGPKVVKSEMVGKLKDFFETRDGKESLKSCDFEKLSPKEIELLVFSDLIYPIDRPKSEFKALGSIYTSQMYRSALEHVKLRQKVLSLKEAMKVSGYAAGMTAYGIFDAMLQYRNLEKLLSYCVATPGFIKKLESLTFVDDVRKKPSQRKQDSIEGYIKPAKSEPGDTHAEMKILNKLLENIDGISPGSKIYIGISKACCFKCHHTLEASKEILLARKDITLLYRGEHDISFPKWEYPRSLRPSKLEGIFQEIKKAAELRFKAMDPQSDVSQRHSLASDSEPEEDFYDKYCIYLESMEKSSRMRIEVCPQSSYDTGDLAKEVQALQVGLKIYKSPVFKDICNDITDDPRTAFRLLVRMVEKEEIEVLKEFLRNPVFAGQKASDYFRTVVNEIEPKEGRKRTREKSTLS